MSSLTGLDLHDNIALSGSLPALDTTKLEIFEAGNCSVVLCAHAPLKWNWDSSSILIGGECQRAGLVGAVGGWRPCTPYLRHHARDHNHVQQNAGGEGRYKIQGVQHCHG